MPMTQFPESFSLVDLNGKNGFSIPGVTLNYLSSWSVTNAGDINDDRITDLVIGTYDIMGRKGASYVVFGKIGIGSSGTVPLSSLDGSNGFVIPAAAAGDNCGWSVSGAGDINADGINDLIIGAPGAGGVGKSYVIFGNAGIGGSGTFNLSTLDGTNGFAISGVAGASGYSVSNLEDINADGIDDLIIGAPLATPGGRSQAGASYVVFGNAGIGSSGSLSLSSLDGSNGFSISGVTANDQSGCSVSAAGDLNGDRINDLIIGARGVASSSGASYVIFGKAEIGGNGTLPLSSLNGSNGFKITGVQADYSTGSSVSNIGDINGDGIDDIVIGAPGAAGPGMSYVVFDKIGIGSSGTFSLSSLDGNNGFGFYGVSVSDMSGSSVSGAGDINGDGISDLIIGAFRAAGGAGMSYVVFGRVGIGSDSLGDISLGILNGKNGFALRGIIGDYSGSFVSRAGDINGDGIADLVIGAYNAMGRTGTSYVVFGDNPVNLLSNSLSIAKGQTQVFNNSYLNATSIKFPSHTADIIYSVSNLQYGYFEQIDNPGIKISSFTQQKIQNKQIQFVHQGGVFAPSYSISASNGRIAALIPPQPAVITFIHKGPSLTKNTFAINQGQVLVLSRNNIGAIDLDYIANNPNLIFYVSNVKQGQFEYVINPGVPTTSFTQGEEQTGNVQFVHYGSTTAPSYDVKVSDGVGGITTAAKAGTVIFNLPPVLINNILSVSQGERRNVTSINLSASDPDDPAEKLVFSLNKVQHGYFESNDNPGAVLTSFLQGQIQKGEIQFVHDGRSAPSYSVSVSDGKATTTMQAAKINFNFAPILGSNALTLKQGETVVLTSNNLSATDSDDAASSLIFVVSEVIAGRFELVTKKGIAIDRFTQAQIQSGLVQFVQDGSSIMPSYNVAVSDGKITILAKPSIINFNAAPKIIKNRLVITQGESHILTPDELRAVDRETEADDLVFTASVVTHGHFEDVTDTDSPGKPITRFKQQKISSAALKFVTDGSAISPTYNISVSDGALATKPSATDVRFSLKEQIPDHTLRNALIGGAVSGAVGLGFFALKTYLERKATVSLQTMMEGGKTGMEVRLIEFHREVLRPVAERIFKQIRTSNIIGYRSSEDSGRYITALESLLGRLVDLKVNLNIKEMAVAQQNRLFSEIVKQIREHVVKKYDCCTCGHIGSFFKVEMTPQMLENKLENIAASIAKAIPDSLREQSVGGDGIELKERKVDRKVMEV